MIDPSDRRGFLAAMGAAAAGALSLEERILLAADEGAGQPTRPKVDIPPGAMPCGLIGKIRISRLFLGGNLIGGWAHSRDLMYVSKLFKAYNTEAKILETLDIAEQCGINTILVDPRDWDPVLKYNRERKRNFQSLVCTLPGTPPASMRDHVSQLIDRGANLVYIHGMVADMHVMNHQIDDLAGAIEAIKRQGLPAGVGAHSLETPITCEDNKLGADFYVKTFHSDRYWSACPVDKREEWCWYKGNSPQHGRYHDNMFCLDSDKVAAFMANIKKPWVAFKTMAAGAIQPQQAFPFAFNGGADFVVAGMFDFQLEQDAKIAIDAVHKAAKRKRPWA